MEKLKGADKLREKTFTWQYRLFYKQMLKAADSGRTSIYVIKLTHETRQILID